MQGGGVKIIIMRGKGSFCIENVDQQVSIR